MANLKLDCSELSCPMPIVKLSKAIKEIQSGEILEITATDKAFRADITAWSKKTGHAIESIREEGNSLVVAIRKAAA